MDRTRAVLLGLAALLLVVSALLVSPFQDFVFLTILLFYPLRPLYERLTEYVSPKIASIVVVVGATVMVVLPVLLVLRTTVRGISSLLGRVRRGEITFTEIDMRITELTGVEVDLAESLRTFAQDVEFGAVDGVLGLFGTITHILIGLGLTMFVLYYLLKDADRLAEWLRATVPLPEHVESELYAEFEDIVWAVLVSHVLVAVIQGVVAGLGLVVVGIPNAVFWTVVMVFLAVLPIIGSFLVWGPASVYLFTTNQPVAGTFLLIYGTIVVGLTDDYLRPIVVDRYTEKRLNPAVIIIGVLGGVYAFGFMGVFVGPVVLSSLRAVLDVYRREFGADDSRPA